MIAPGPPNIDALRRKFEDFDKEDVYERAKQRASDAQAQNFVVLFGPHHARIAIDLKPADFKDLFFLNDEDYPVRWINFWSTSSQKDAIKLIGNHYGFGRRLLSSIMHWDDLNNMIRGRGKKPQVEQVKTEKRPEVLQSENKDLEAGLSEQGTWVQAPVQTQAQSQAVLAKKLENLDNFQLLQDTLNYTTTDHGPDFFCFGAHWLHKPPTGGGHAPVTRLVLPHHWAWYALCADSQTRVTNTVVSVHEAPRFSKPPPGGDITVWRAAELRNMRENTVAVLEQLSTEGIKEYANNLFFQKAIRETRQKESWERSFTQIPADKVTPVAASNLFYYLFEDYSIVVPVLKISGQVLQELSDRVLKPTRKDGGDTKVVKDLHELGKGLRFLLHLFESYKSLFETICKEPPSEANGVAVTLESRARDRFQRLIDRLQVLMLNTIREYMNEKTELSSTYFNLTAQKDSEATARLTRSATLLAKLSVFFLPISFITSYFSVQIPELNNAYTAKTYWYTFAVVATLSFVSLFFFSRLLMILSDWLDIIADSLSQRTARLVGRWRGHDKAD